MNPATLPERLLCAVPYIPPHARVADVGTDHAYLPICLVKEGVCSEALATDINEGPIAVAARHIAAAGLDDKIRTLRTDGLRGVEEFRPDVVLIFGMGGELIARILGDAPWLKERGTRLILQPMSRAGVLRRFLNENGYRISDETLSRDGEKYYQIIVASFAGAGEDYTEEEYRLGKKILQTKSPLRDAFLRHEIGVMKKVVRGKSKSSDADAEADERMIRNLEKYLEDADREDP